MAWRLRLIEETQADGTVIGYRYNRLDEVTQQVVDQGIDADSRNAETYYQYDDAGRLTTEIDAEGNATLYDYDGVGNLVRETRGLQLDVDGSPVAHQLNLSDATGFMGQDYADVGSVTKTADSMSLQGNRWQQVFYPVTIESDTVLEFRFSADGLSEIHSIGFTNSAGWGDDEWSTSTHFQLGGSQSTTHIQDFNTYDAGDGEVLIRIPVGQYYTGQFRSLVFTNDHDASPEMGSSYFADVRIFSANARVTEYLYDAANRQTGSIVDPDGLALSTSYEYDMADNQTAMIDANGHRTEMEYDALNRLVLERDAEGNVSRSEYDAFGNKTKVTDPLGRVSRFYFDQSDNLISVLDPEGYVNEFDYDALGNVVQERVYMTRYSGVISDTVPPTATSSSLDRISSSVYDSNNRVIARTESDGSRTESVYDAVGNLVRELQYANTSSPREMLWSHDLNNRVVSFTDVDGTVSSFEYDGLGNRIVERSFNATDPNPVRETRYAFDLNGRVVSETFDPDGLNYVQRSHYDGVGNVIQRTDARGVVSTFFYDAANRLASQIDALGQITSFSYDAAGNRTSITDARGYTTHYEFDANNRLIGERQPSVSIFTIANGTQTMTPATQRVYDAVGNEVQTIDAAGFVTTRYFDNNNRLIAEINGDNVLTRWSYNAAGDEVTESLYMARLPETAHDPLVLPSSPTGEVRTITREYDLVGRETRVVYPEIEVTTLSGVESNSPTASTATVQPEETIVYDAFGNAVESTDVNGNRTLIYYDVKGRQVAMVDGAGYLTELEYDAQDNVLEQRSYTVALDTSTLSATTRPTPPTGEVYITNRRYDAANRMIEERSPMVDVFDPDTGITTSERIHTTYAYDAANNQIRKTLAAGTADAITEYSYYDAINQKVVVINDQRVVHLFAYDANGNQTLQKRFFNTIAAGIELSSLTAATDFAALVGANAQDQETRLSYDVLNRLTSETELMGEGDTDDLVKLHAYNARGERTRSVDEEGFVSQFAYNAMGRSVQNIAPDGTGNISTFDAAGNQVLAYTGILDNSATPVDTSTISATVGSELNLNWSMPDRPAGSSGQSSYVVFDTVSRNSIDDYSQRSATVGTWYSSTGSAQIDLEALELNAGGTVFFRVVTQDTAGNIAWGEEQQVTLPPSFDDVSITQTGTNTYEVRTEFTEGVINPRLYFGPSGSLYNSRVFTPQGAGQYVATITGYSNIQNLSYQIRWQDAIGTDYASTEVPFEALGNHLGSVTTVSESAGVSGSDTNYQVNLDIQVPTAVASGLVNVTADILSVNDELLDSVSVVTHTDGLYSLTLGSAEPFVAGNYQIAIRAAAENDDLTLDVFTLELGTAEPVVLTRPSFSFNNVSVGSSHLAIVGGVNTETATEEGSDRLTIATDLAPGSSADYALFYGETLTSEHNTAISATEITETTGNPPVVNVLGYDLGIATTFDALETANVTGDLQLEWRSATTGITFSNQTLLAPGHGYGLSIVPDNGPLPDTGNSQVAISQSLEGDYLIRIFEFDGQYSDYSSFSVELTELIDNKRLDDLSSTDEEIITAIMTEFSHIPTYTEYAAILPLLTAGEYDLKISYTDANGDEVIVDWLRVDTSTALTEITGNSLTVVATETDASITYQSGGSLVVDPGLFDGQQTDDFSVPLNLAVTGTGLLGDSRTTDGRETGYFIQNEFNALNSLIATNSETGHWRLFGVDAAGNTVVTNDYGQVERSAIEGGGLTARSSFSVFDGRHREVTRFGVAAPVAGETGLQHAVTHIEYDVNDKVTLEQGPTGGTARTYNAMGNMLTESKVHSSSHQDTDTYRYNRLGKQVAMIDALGNTSLQFFDEHGRLVREQNGNGHSSTYELDAFDRRTAVINALGSRVEANYDHRDRQTSTVALGVQLSNGSTAVDLTTSYEYDGRNNRTLTTDANGHTTEQVYDALGRVIDTITYQNGQAIHDRRQYDSYGNLVGEIDGEGRAKTSVYANFGQLVQSVDIGGRVTQYQYNRYGETVRETNASSGKNIERTYDLAGRLIAINDHATDIDTTYTYDVLGNRITEVLTINGVDTRHITYEYDDFNRMVRWFDGITGMNLSYLWDARGNLHRAFTDQGFNPNVVNSINFSGLMGLVNDIWTSATIEVGSDEDGNTITEPRYENLRDYVGSQGVSLAKYDSYFLVKRTTSYDEDAGSTTTFDWTVSPSSRPAYQAELLRDLGYEAEVQALFDAAYDPTYQFIDHQYSYDDNNQVTLITQNGNLWRQYGYDAAGNRVTYNDGTNLNTYDYNSLGWVLRGEVNSNNYSVWTYDDVGNVLGFRNVQGGDTKQNDEYRYWENNRQYRIRDHEEDQTTIQSFDRSGRLLKTTVEGDESTTTFNYYYNNAGLQTSIRARGKNIRGSTSISYDANDNQTYINKGRGEKQVRSEIQRLVYNNDGQIIHSYKDNGKKGQSPYDTDYLYANGNPVGETGTNTAGQQVTKLDVGRYNLVQNLGEDFPEQSVTNYIAREGDTLRGIASAIFGNPSLWYLIADANALDPDEPIKAGTSLTIPNTAQTGELTSDTFRPYDPGEITESSLPNIKQKKSGCGGFMMILIVVVIAVVATILTGGLALSLVPAFTGTLGVAAGTVAAYAVAGFVVGAAASIVQQGVLIALGYPVEFSWREVAASAVSGAFSGAAQGVGKAAQALQALEKAEKFHTFIKYAKVASAALKLAGEASKQLILNHGTENQGKITSWTSLAVSGISGYVETGKAIEAGKEVAGKAIDVVDAIEQADIALRAGTVASDTFNTLNRIQTITDYVSPWVQIAEASYRNDGSGDDGELTSADWAGAVGSTLGTFVASDFVSNTKIGQAVPSNFRKLGANLAVGAALYQDDKDEGRSFIENAFGNTFGEMIGQEIGQGLNGYLNSLNQPKGQLVLGLTNKSKGRIRTNDDLDDLLERGKADPSYREENIVISFGDSTHLKIDTVGPEGYSDKALEHLSSLTETSVGQEMLIQLANTDRRITLVYEEGASVTTSGIYDNGASSIIGIDLFAEEFAPNAIFHEDSLGRKKLGSIPTVYALAHELYHAGQFSGNSFFEIGPSVYDMDIELHAVEYVNMLRVQRGDKVRVAADETPGRVSAFFGDDDYDSYSKAQQRLNTFENSPRFVERRISTGEVNSASQTTGHETISTRVGKAIHVNNTYMNDALKTTVGMIHPSNSKLENLLYTILAFPQGLTSSAEDVSNFVLDTPSRVALAGDPIGENVAKLIHGDTDPNSDKVVTTLTLIRDTSFAFNDAGAVVSPATLLKPSGRNATTKIDDVIETGAVQQGDSSVQAIVIKQGDNSVEAFVVRHGDDNVEIVFKQGDNSVEASVVRQGDNNVETSVIRQGDNNVEAGVVRQGDDAVEAGVVRQGDDAVEGGANNVSRASDDAFDVTKVTAKDIPSYKSGRFNEWFDARTPEEIQFLYNSDKKIRRKIENGLRADGGMHEFLMVSRAPKWKGWGVKTQQVHVDYAVPTEKLRWVIPEDLDHPLRGQLGGHRIVDDVTGKVTAPGSTTFHLELDTLITNSSSLRQFDDGLRALYERWQVYILD